MASSSSSSSIPSSNSMWSDPLLVQATGRANRSGRWLWDSLGEDKWLSESSSASFLIESTEKKGVSFSGEENVDKCWTYIYCMRGRARGLTTVLCAGEAWGRPRGSSCELWSWQLQSSGKIYWLQSSPGLAWAPSSLVTLSPHHHPRHSHGLASAPGPGYLSQRSWMFLAFSWTEAFRIDLLLGISIKRFKH